MSKSIFVMDTPRVCLDCRFCRKLRVDACCELSDDPEDPECLRLIGDDFSKEKPDWCPLEEYQEAINNIGELLPCPFCGGEAKFETLENGASHYNVNLKFTIRCSKCNCSLPKSYNLRLSLGNKGDINYE